MQNKHHVQLLNIKPGGK